MLEYMGELIEQTGSGYMYDGIAFPEWCMVTEWIDIKLNKQNNIVK